jgi:hypothetical protein
VVRIFCERHDCLRRRAAAAATDSSNKLTIIRQAAAAALRWASGGIPSHTPQNTCYFHSQSCTENQNARSRCARGRAAALLSQGLAGGGSCNRSASNLMLTFKTISSSGVLSLAPKRWPKYFQFHYWVFAFSGR